MFVDVIFDPDKIVASFDAAGDAGIGVFTSKTCDRAPCEAVPWLALILLNSGSASAGCGRLPDVNPDPGPPPGRACRTPHCQATLLEGGRPRSPAGANFVAEVRNESS